MPRETSFHNAEFQRGLLLAVLLLAFGGRLFELIGFGTGLGELFVPGFVESGAEADVDRKALAGATFIYAADWRDVTIVAAIGNADVAKFDRFAEGGIKTEPAAAGQENF